MMDKNGSDGERELIFVYNASSDLIGRLKGFVHKIISPQTYSCNLCKLSHGNTGMHKEWAEYIQELPYKVSFQYKDQWLNYQNFPLVLLKNGEEVNTVVSPEELNQVGSLEELIDWIKEKMKD